MGYSNILLGKKMLCGFELIRREWIRGGLVYAEEQMK